MNKIRQQFTHLGGFALMLAFMIAPMLLVVGFLRGALWLSEHVLPVVITVGWIVLALDVLIVLPLAIFRRTRMTSANLLMLSSYVYGLAAWMFGLIVTYELWGSFAVVLGLFMFGVGVVPMALLASLFRGQWAVLVMLVVMIVLTYGTRWIVVKLAASTAPTDREIVDFPEDIDGEVIDTTARQ